MVVMFMLGILKLLFMLLIFYITFSLVEKLLPPNRVNIDESDIQLGVSTENDGFFMAAMYQDMGNDL
jgi:predicted metal-binding membrane protein|tara:strand:+ start:2034 stop:2234 length:201 start_codon:yes stop_codon:yes gene_type:complete